MALSDSDMARIDDEAALWVARAYAPDVSDQDLSNLTDWLEASADHGLAFDRAEAAWLAADALAGDPAVTGDEAVKVVDLTVRRTAHSRKPVAPALVWSMVGAAAAAMVAVCILPPLFNPTSPATVYTTAKGERRDVVLADGTQLHLDGDTRIEVRMTATARRIDLQGGELALSVVHNAARPLTVQAGDTSLRDIGTDFNVQRVAGRVTVTVRSGAVAVSHRGDDTSAPPLLAGDQAAITEGQDGVARRKVDVAAAYGWQKDQVVYQDEPLSYVVSDLNRHFTKPLVVDEATGKLRLNAVIQLDSEATVVKRLQAFLPIEATTTQTAVTLRRRP